MLDPTRVGYAGTDRTQPSERRHRHAMTSPGSNRITAMCSLVPRGFNRNVASDDDVEEVASRLGLVCTVHDNSAPSHLHGLSRQRRPIVPGAQFALRRAEGVEYRSEAVLIVDWPAAISRRRRDECRQMCPRQRGHVLWCAHDNEVPQEVIIEEIGHGLPALISDQI